MLYWHGMSNKMPVAQLDCSVPLVRKECVCPVAELTGEQSTRCFAERQLPHWIKYFWSAYSFWTLLPSATPALRLNWALRRIVFPVCVKCGYLGTHCVFYCFVLKSWSCFPVWAQHGSHLCKCWLADLSWHSPGIGRDLFQLKQLIFTLRSVVIINSSKFSNCTKLEYCAKCTEVLVPDLSKAHTLFTDTCCNPTDPSVRASECVCGACFGLSKGLSWNLFSWWSGSLWCCSSLLLPSFPSFCGEQRDVAALTFLFVFFLRNTLEQEVWLLDAVFACF